ncbi:MAG TPA: SAM-dependent methyltransferase [Blastocatellia bacterium]|nr:SAM-dependent methyltransferase [Blastocatellia bacterium]
MNSVDRFSSRVENYAKFRPGYPPGILDVLKSDCGLTEESVIADIGSGTGFLSKVFLKHGNVVFGIEPNELMRAKADELLKSFANFRSVAATAETTTLPDGSVDFVTAGQAFHWFDRANAKREFIRILKPDGWVVLVWNARRLDATAFLRDYEGLLLRYSPDYPVVRHENIDAEIIGFFAPQPMKLASLENVQRFDFEALKGRLCSSSYAPEPVNPNFELMLKDLKDIFNTYNENGVVNFDYDTRIYYGHLRG